MMISYLYLLSRFGYICIICKFYRQKIMNYLTLLIHIKMYKRNS